MKRILIALDNHENYHLISNKGYELAAALMADVALLHVYPDPYKMNVDAFSPLYPSLSSESLDNEVSISEKLKAESEQFLNKVKSGYEDETTQILTAQGDVADEILDAANSFKADIIVIGTHSRSGIEKLLLGNVAQKVLKHSHKPLFIVPVR